MKICPVCAEDIQDEARKCKHCMEWVEQPRRRAEENINVRDFILKTGAEAQRIAKKIRPQLKQVLRTRGFQRVTLTGDSMPFIWRLQMTKPPPAISSDEVERILDEAVGELRYKDEHYQIKDGLVATVASEEQIKSAFFLSPRAKNAPGH